MLCAALLLLAFDASKFRTSCSDSAFCRASRPGANPAPAPFELDLSSVASTSAGASMLVWQPQLGRNSTLRLLLRPAAVDPARPAPGAPAWRLQLIGSSHGANHFLASSLVLPPLSAPRLAVEVQHSAATDGSSHVLRAVRDGYWSELRLRSAPLAIRLYAGEVGRAVPEDEVALASVNERGLLRFAASDPSCDGGVERWRGFMDSRPHGCTAIAADVSFGDALEVFGLPERAAPLALPATMKLTERASMSATGEATRDTSFAPTSEPYRLFNLDIFEYGPDTPIGLYGSTPFLVAHGAHRRHAQHRAQRHGQIEEP